MPFLFFFQLQREQIPARLYWAHITAQNTGRQMPAGTHLFYSVFTIAGYLRFILHGIVQFIRIIGHNAIGA